MKARSKKIKHPETRAENIETGRLVVHDGKGTVMADRRFIFRGGESP
jgi:hypothetical protein